MRWSSYTRGPKEAPRYVASSFSAGHAHTTRTSCPRAANRVANWYARLSAPPIGLKPRLVKSSLIWCESDARAVPDRPLRRGCGVFDAEELEPLALPGANVTG